MGQLWKSCHKGTQFAHHVSRTQTHYHVVVNEPELHHEFKTEPAKELAASSGQKS